MNDDLQDEIMLLESVYTGEFEVSTASDGRTLFVMEILPSTAGDVSSQNVCATLRLDLPLSYPLDIPIVSLQKLRGLSDLQQAALLSHLENAISVRKGSPMIYDLIDVIKDYLTRSNFPSVECPFCLCFIEEGDEFCKTPCLHYFHAFCLRRYLDFVHKQIREQGEDVDKYKQLGKTCVVCRAEFLEAISVEEKTGVREPKSLKAVDTILLSESVQHEQERRNQIFQKQKLKKGIIELKADDVITLNHIPEMESIISVTDD